MKKILLVLGLVLFASPAFASTTYLGHFATECVGDQAVYKFENNSVASPYKWEVVDVAQRVLQSGSGVADVGAEVRLSPAQTDSSTTIRVSWPKNDGDWNYIGNTQDNNVATFSQARCEAATVVVPVTPPAPVIVPSTTKTITVNGQTYTVAKNPVTTREQIISLVSQLMELY